MKHKKFTKPKAGEWIKPVSRGYLMACCDCGLVHRMDFRVNDGSILFRVFRARNYTASLRRLKGIALRTGVK